jgi:hypothetical protein
MNKWMWRGKQNNPKFELIINSRGNEQLHKKGNINGVV